jgi:hypothetical protein
MILFFSVCSAQLLDTLWSKAIQDTCGADAWFTHLIPLKNGDCIATFSHHAVIKRVSPNGAIVWTTTFVNKGTRDVIELENGDLIALLYMGNPAIDSTFIACISANGQNLWSKVIPLTAAQSILHTDSIDILFYRDLERPTFRRYASDMTGYRQIGYGDDPTLYPTYFSKTPLGGYVFSGEMKIHSRDSVLVWCTDQMGIIRWRKTVGSWYDVHIPKIMTDQHGGVYYTLRDKTSECHHS